MNWGRVYGQVIVNVPAPEMISGGFIVPPQIVAQEIKSDRDKEFAAERDCMTLLDTILNEDNMQKVLVAAPNTKVLIRMLAETEFMTEVQSYGYEVLWITSKYGAFINNQKVDFFFFHIPSLIPLHRNYDTLIPNHFQYPSITHR